MNRPPSVSLRLGTIVLAATSVVAGALAGVEQTRASDAGREEQLTDTQNCLYALELTNALNGRSVLSVLLDHRSSGFVMAFGMGRQFNRMPYSIDASGLKIVSAAGSSVSGAVGRVTGELKVTVYSDGYVPKGIDSLSCEYTISADIVGDRVVGMHKGKYGTTEVSGGVSGALSARAVRAEQVRFVLNMENAIGVTKGRKGGGRRATATITMANGKVVGAVIAPAGSLTDVSCAIRVEKTDMRYAASRLAGVVFAAVTPQGGGDTVRYVYSIDAQVIGETLAGSFSTRMDDKEVEGGRFLGSARFGVLPDAANATWKMTLHDVLGKGQFLDVYLDSRNGRLAGGFGTTPNFNNATHDVDLSEVSVSNGILSGNLKVTVSPDPWVPLDHKPIPCELVLDAVVRDGVVTGRYTGVAGATNTAGNLDGVLDKSRASGSFESGTLKLENALVGGNPMENRVFLSFTVDNGKVTGGKISNNHSTLGGTVEGGELTIENATMSGKFSATVGADGNVTAGKYEFVVDGCVVGSIGAGSFKTSIEGKGLVKTGRYWCALKSK